LVCNRNRLRCSLDTIFLEKVKTRLNRKDGYAQAEYKQTLKAMEF
ncbi:unnamed protein product, partial [marine sediment metagenome]